MLYEQSRILNFAKTILAVPIALIVCIIVSGIEFYLIGFFGTGEGLFVIFLQEWLAPGIGGYAAMYAIHHFLPSVKLSFVLWTFSPIALFLISALPTLHQVYFAPGTFVFTWSFVFVRLLGGVCAILGAWLAHSKINTEN